MLKIHKKLSRYFSGLFAAVMASHVFIAHAHAQTAERWVQVELRNTVGLVAYRSDFGKQSFSVSSRGAGTFYIYGGQQDMAYNGSANELSLRILDRDAGVISETCLDMLNAHSSNNKILKALAKPVSGRVVVSGIVRNVKYTPNFVQGTNFLEVEVLSLQNCSQS
jgi:hypothetical protein